MHRIVIIVVFAIGLVALLVYSQRPDERLVVSGNIEADDVRVGSRVGGRVLAVRVEEGQSVTKGTPLIELEAFDLHERKAEAQQSLTAADAQLAKLVTGYRSEEIAQARAKVDEAKAALAELESGPRPQEIAAANAQVRLAQAELDEATRDHERIASLFASGTADQSELDDVTTKLSVAQATLEDRREKLDLLVAGTRRESIEQSAARLRHAQQELALRESGYRPEDVAEARAHRDAAHAALAIIDRQLEELTIAAPFDGVVETVDLRPGDIVSPNAPVVSLLDTRRLYVRAYVPENRLDLVLGQTVAVSVDSFPDERFDGEVTFIARHAEFTPNNVQTPEERSKQVFRIRVDLRSGLERLRPGMVTDVHLDAESRR